MNAITIKNKQSRIHLYKNYDRRLMWYTSSSNFHKIIILSL